MKVKLLMSASIPPFSFAFNELIPLMFLLFFSFTFLWSFGMIHFSFHFHFPISYHLSPRLLHLCPPPLIVLVLIA